MTSWTSDRESGQTLWKEVSLSVETMNRNLKGKQEFGVLLALFFTNRASLFSEDRIYNIENMSEKMNWGPIITVLTECPTS